MVLTLLLLSTILLNMYEISSNAIPIHRNSEQYLDFPDENVKEYKKPVEYFYPKKGFGYKRDYDGHIDDVLHLNTIGETQRAPEPGNPYADTDPNPDKQLNSNETVTLDDLGLKKRSFKSLELYEKLIALGVDYVEIMNLLTPLHRNDRNTKDLD